MTRISHAGESGTRRPCAEEDVGVDCGISEAPEAHDLHSEAGSEVGSPLLRPETGCEPRYRVLEPGFSRNRHFDWYESPDGKALRHFRRIIQGLSADLERVDDDQPILFQFDEENGRVWVELYIPKFRATRRSCLKEPEFEALRSHPRIGPRLVLRAS